MKIENLSGRLQSLIERGYSMEEVAELSSFSEEDMNHAVETAFSSMSQGCYPSLKPTAFYVGGQPGSGKTVTSMRLKHSYPNMLEIGIDNYRTYHSNYFKIEECIRRHWENRTPKENDTPGNDLADFTHSFAGLMTDKLIEKATNGKYDVILEWGMRDPIGPLQSMQHLKNMGYDINVLFMVVHKDLSLKACDLRAEVGKDQTQIIRKVPPVFHQLCIDTLPDSIDYIAENGFSSHPLGTMRLITREGTVVWDSRQKDKLPSEVFNHYLHNSELSESLQNNEMLARVTLNKEREGLHMERHSSKSRVA